MLKPCAVNILWLTFGRGCYMPREASEPGAKRRLKGLLMEKVRLIELAIACTVLAAAAPTSADTIYDNSKNDLLTRFNPGDLEVADEIQLAGTARYLTNFAFEFWGENPNSPDSFVGNVQARVRFYQNDGPEFNGYPSPGSTFYDSGWFTIDQPTPRNTLRFVAGDAFPESGLFIPVGLTMTWSVQFQRDVTSDSIGLDIYSPVVEGASFPDYWENDGAGWQLKNNVVPMDFAALLEASVVAVPESSTLVLSVLGGVVLLFGLGRLRSRRLADDLPPRKYSEIPKTEHKR
jgi:hypothetical protein